MYTIRNTVQIGQAAPATPVKVNNPRDEQTPTHESSKKEGRELLDLADFRIRSMTKRREIAKIDGTCSCGPMGSVSGRFWWLDYTPLSSLWQNCGSKSCTKRRYEWKIRLALSRLHIPYAVIASLQYTSGLGRIGIRPALNTQQVVRNTSPGFQTLFLCRNYRISVEEGKQRLRDIYRSDPASFKSHVNPGGESYMRASVHHAFRTRHKSNTRSISSVTVHGFGYVRMSNSNSLTSLLQSSI